MDARAAGSERVVARRVAAPSVRGAASDRGDLAQLYIALAGQVERTVRKGVEMPDGMVEDACQFAWSQFVSHCCQIQRDAALSWLTTTALREAFKLRRRADRDLSLDALCEGLGDAVMPTVVEVEELLEARDRLQDVRRLSRRQQRLLWLQAIGLSYTEMATHEGCTKRTVQRQLLRARGAVAAASGG
jgi:RNA polymerase sigma factor (sigma-70 family)